MMKQLLALIYPPKCLLCRNILTEVADEYICYLCYDKFKGETQQLLKQYQLEDLSMLMSEQEDNENLMPQCVALFPYTSEYRSAILHWKYKGIRRYAKGLAQLLVEEQKVFEKVKVDGVIPVPLAPSRLKKRGFNQALDLANEVACLMQVPVWDCLKRSRDTKPQSACTREARYKNIKDSILLDESGLQKKEQMVKYVVLIDDIYTTGSTVKECIKVLKQNDRFKDTVIDIVVAGKGDF